MNKIETAINSLGCKDAEQAREYMSAACNTYGLDIKTFVELMAAQNRNNTRHLVLRHNLKPNSALYRKRSGCFNGVSPNSYHCSIPARDGYGEYLTQSNASGTTSR